MTDWKRKVVAWLHDPAEKALILMRTREGHERGTAAALRERLGIEGHLFDRRADWLASAADRPNWPRPTHARYPAWERVRFTDQPVLIHPLSGETLEMPPLSADIAPDAASESSYEHFERLIHEGDPRRTFLAFWRFGPELGHWDQKVGKLWNMLPADSRTPDHSLWQHVELVSALHTCLDDGDTPALLSIQLGPVQGFIAQARTTSDLWAGSHLLASAVWASLRSIAQSVGPDAVLFPSLFASPFADAWLMEDEQLGERGRELMRQVNPSLVTLNDDRNPLFSASLPNRLLALVPSRRAQHLAEQAVDAARQFMHATVADGAGALFDRAGLALSPATQEQLSRQLEGFPEASWSITEWPNGGADARALDEPARVLRAALSDIDPGMPSAGLFNEASWPLLNREYTVDGYDFWRPNAGLLYSAAYTLNERTLAAARATRCFDGQRHEGFRCTLCGEREWLTLDRDELMRPPGQRSDSASPWSRLAERAPSLVKAGEFLCALCTAKRSWPTNTAATVANITRDSKDKATRFVVSTHALALSTSLERLAGDVPLQPEQAAAVDKLSGIVEADSSLESAMLPGRLVRRLAGSQRSLHLARKLPALLERIRGNEATGIAGVSTGCLAKLVAEAFSAPVETYYALVLMDGDRMGAWLSGSADEYRLRFAETWHPAIRAKMKDFASANEPLSAYMNALRPLSPARHSSISRALGNFSSRIARHIVEDCAKGRLLYSGGDDVLAMVAVDDVADVMVMLRCAYSGIALPAAVGKRRGIAAASDWNVGGSGGLQLGRGYAMLDGQLLGTMGPRATASMGAVIAHHQAPLSRVLGQLREAEARAKTSGRDRFCLRVLKRGGGEVSMDSPWWTVPVDDASAGEPVSVLGLVNQLESTLAEQALSRSSLYRTDLWLEALPDLPASEVDEAWRSRAAASIAAQFARGSRAGDSVGSLPRDLVDCLCDTMRPDRCRTALGDLLAIAEFTARACRSSPRKEANE